MTDRPDDDDLLDGCDLDFRNEALPDDDGDLFVLFAEALDWKTPVTVDDAVRDWQEVFGADPRTR